MKKKINKSTWTSGITLKSTMSYETYMKMGLDIIHKNLSLRVYKLAPREEYPSFERGKDLRIGFFWKGEPIVDKTRKERKHEIVVETSFWYTSNKNKEDREWMRSFADLHLKQLHEAVSRGKEDYNKKAKKKTKATKATANKKTKVKIVLDMHCHRGIIEEY